jgi:hypothetical protein
MADRFPLIVNSTDQQIQELVSGDNIDLTGSGIVADVFTVDTNSSERLRIDSSGNMGLGINSPSSRLHVKGAADSYLTLQAGTTDGNDGVLFQNSGGTQKGALLYDTDDNYLLFNVNSAERIRIDSSGRLGIADSNPNFTLDVNGNVGIREDNSLTFHDGAGVAAFRIRGDSSNKLFFERASGNELQMVIDDGNVGIGTDPATKFHIKLDTDKHIRFQGNIGEIGSVPGFQGVTDAGALAGLGMRGSDLRFATGSSERMRIDSSGKLILGTTTAATNAEVTVRAASPQLSLYATPGNTSRVTLGDTDDYDIGQIEYANSDNSMRFTTNASERLRMDSSGRLLVGTTTAGDAAADDLTLSSSGDTGITIRASETDSSSIYFADGTGGTNVYTGAIIYDHATNHMSLHTNSGAERVRIDSSGNIGINQTSISATRKVEITQPSGYSGALRILSASSSGNPGFIEWFSGLSQYKIGINHGTDALKFLRDSTELMRITSSGRMGIGESSPAANLEITPGTGAGTVLLNNASGSMTDGALNIEVGSGGALYETRKTGGLAHIWYATGAERMRIDTSGRIGIGQTSPQGDLHIGNISGSKDIIMHSANNGNARLRFREGGTNTSGFNEYSIGMAGNQNAITFETQGTGEAMRIDSSGRVGIKNSSMSSLYSGGDDLVIGDGGGSNQGITIFTGTGNQGILAFADGFTGAAQQYAGYLLYDHNDDRMTFATTGQERARITSSGTSYFRGDSNAVWAFSGQSAGTSFRLFYGAHSAGTDFSGGTSVYTVWTNGNVVNANNSYGSLSDAKLKENIVDASSQWNDIKDLRVRKYNFIEGQTHTQIGVVAQEVETISPGLVYESPDTDEEGNDLGTTTKSVNYSILYMKSVKALQEAMDRIETLEAKVAALEAG